MQALKISGHLHLALVDFEAGKARIYVIDAVVVGETLIALKSRA